MFRFILVACLIAGFVVPPQVSADMGISKFKIAGGIGFLDMEEVGDTFGGSVNAGFVVYRFDNENLLGLVEGTFEHYSLGLAGTTGRIISVNTLMLNRFSRGYFFGGMGLARVTASVSVNDLSVSDSEIKLNFIAGAGIDINELLLAEARWSHQGGDLLVTIGFKIH